jgi:R3H-associated N-terminal domain
MAIHPSVRSEHAERTPVTSLTQQQAIDISAWTEQAAASLQVLDISDSVAEIEFPISSSNAATAVRGTSNTLSIPLDGPIVKSSTPRVTIVRSSGDDNVSTVPSNVYRRREPLRRDSMKRREALLKGKEGSRRRQRWENGAFVEESTNKVDFNDVF